MHPTLRNILKELDHVVSALNAYVESNEPFSIAYGWSTAGLTRSELVERATALANAIRERAPNNLGNNEKLLADYVRRIDFLRSNTIPNISNSGGKGLVAYVLTLDGLSKALAPVLKDDTTIADEFSKRSQQILKRLRGVEARLEGAEPRSVNLTDMVARIEQAYEAADQLPADLQSLADDRTQIKQILMSAQAAHTDILRDKELIEKSRLSLAKKEEEAKSVLDLCHSAYSAATSQGLAAAFSERSKGLANSMWVWSVAFVIALVAGAYFGTQRVHEIGELLENPALTGWSLITNLLLAALSVGAPIWFGWLANKQINQRFRLSEDYAFKAAVSSAYEGYRREAARIDEDMEAKLLASALARLDEQPLRFVETENHGSPWHEIASSSAVKEAVKLIPGFASRIEDLAKSTLNAISQTRATKPETSLHVATAEDSQKAQG